MVADTEPEKQTKRRLRAPAPTVRQQAEKAQAESDKPAKPRRLKSAASAAGRPVLKVGKWFDRQPFRFISLIIFPRYFRSAFQELRLVTWPKRKETWQLTYAVLAFAVVFGISIALVDYGLDKLFKNILLK